MLFARESCSSSLLFFSLSGHNLILLPLRINLSYFFQFKKMFKNAIIIFEEDPTLQKQ